MAGIQWDGSSDSKGCLMSEALSSLSLLNVNTFPQRKSKHQVKNREPVPGSIWEHGWNTRGMSECRYAESECWGKQREAIICQWRTARNRNRWLVTATNHCSVRLFTGLSGKKWQEEVRVNTKRSVFPFFFLIFFSSLPSFLRYSGATCGLAFVFVYPSLIYVISLHRAGQLTWPVLIIHIFIIVLGLANLIAQFLLWKLPLLPVAVTSGTMTFDNRLEQHSHTWDPNSPQYDLLVESCTFEINSKHICQALERKPTMLL